MLGSAAKLKASQNGLPCTGEGPHRKVPKLSERILLEGMTDSINLTGMVGGGDTEGLVLSLHKHFEGC